MKREGLNCTLFVLLIFGLVYMGLMGVYKIGRLATVIAAALFFIIGLYLLWHSTNIENERKRNYYGIVSGLFLWAALGEAIEQLGVISLPALKMTPLLISWCFLIVFSIVKKYFPSGIMFSLGMFTATWSIHAIMVNQFEFLGRNHWSTYVVAGVFLLLAILFGYRMSRTKSDTKNMAYAVALLLAAWSVLEYTWGWRLLPGPWMLH